MVFAAQRLQLQGEASQQNPRQAWYEPNCERRREDLNGERNKSPKQTPGSAS